MQAALAGAGDSTREAQLLESWKAYKRGFQQGVALFNAKPKKGIAFLQAPALPGLAARSTKFLATCSRKGWAIGVPACAWGQPTLCMRTVPTGALAAACAGRYISGSGEG
jgi:hypothetical protein